MERANNNNHTRIILDCVFYKKTPWKTKMKKDFWTEEDLEDLGLEDK